MWCVLFLPGKFTAVCCAPVIMNHLCVPVLLQVLWLWINDTLYHWDAVNWEKWPTSLSSLGILQLTLMFYILYMEDFADKSETFELNESPGDDFEFFILDFNNKLF